MLCYNYTLSIFKNFCLLAFTASWKKKIHCYVAHPYCTLHLYTSAWTWRILLQAPPSQSPHMHYSQYLPVPSRALETGRPHPKNLRSRPCWPLSIYTYWTLSPPASLLFQSSLRALGGTMHDPTTAPHSTPWDTSPFQRITSPEPCHHSFTTTPGSLQWPGMCISHATKGSISMPYQCSPIELILSPYMEVVNLPSSPHTTVAIPKPPWNDHQRQSSTSKT